MEVPPIGLSSSKLVNPLKIMRFRPEDIPKHFEKVCQGTLEDTG